MSSQWDTDLYKVAGIVNDLKDDAPVYTINLKTDLQPGLSISRSTVWREDGRPLTREYKIGATVYARKYYYFILDGNGLMTRRTIYMHFILNDGTEGPQILIKDETFTSADNDVIFAEQIEARKRITSEIKDTVLAALVLVHYPAKTMPEIVAIGIPFVQASEGFKHEFEEYGYPTYKTYIQGCDPQAVGFEWMATDIGGGETLQDYMEGALTYTPETNHPEA